MANKKAYTDLSFPEEPLRNPDYQGYHIVYQTRETLRNTYLAHWHTEYEINYVFNEYLDVLLNGKTQRVLAGQALFINPRSIHGKADPVPDAHRCCGIIFSNDFLFGSRTDTLYAKYIYTLYEAGSFFKSFIAGNEPFEKEMLGLIRDVVKADQEKKAGYELKIRASLLSLFSVYFENNAFETAVTAYTERIGSIQNTIKYIEEHFDDEIRVQELADMAHYSLEHFSRLFKQVTGKSPQEYIMDYRIGAAMKMLERNEKSVTDIAYDCGFSEAPYFSRLFKMKNGKTPFEYRKALCKQPVSP
jgi:AraC-like DNA-binding protein